MLCKEKYYGIQNICHRFLGHSYLIFLLPFLKCRLVISKNLSCVIYQTFFIFLCFSDYLTCYFFISHLLKFYGPLVLVLIYIQLLIATQQFFVLHFRPLSLWIYRGIWWSNQIPNFCHISKCKKLIPKNLLFLLFSQIKIGWIYLTPSEIWVK